MQWDEECFNALFVSEAGNDTTLEDLCHCKNDSIAAVDPFQSLTFVDDTDLAHDADGTVQFHVPSLPWTISLLVRSGDRACGNILDATLFETNMPLYTATRAPTSAPTSSPTQAPTSENENTPEPVAASKEETEAAPGKKKTEVAPVHRATQATVVAQADGTYKVSATIVSTGTHELMVSNLGVIPSMRQYECCNV